MTIRVPEAYEHGAVEHQQAEDYESSSDSDSSITTSSDEERYSTELITDTDYMQYYFNTMLIMRHKVQVATCMLLLLCGPF